MNRFLEVLERQPQACFKIDLRLPSQKSSSLGEAIGFVIYGTRPSPIHVSPVRFFLRMLQRIAITFRCRRKQIFRVILERYIKRVECSQRSGFESFDSMNGVVHRTRRAGEVKYVIDSSAIERLVDVKLAKFKPAFVAQMLKIGLPTCQQVINRDNRVTFTQKRVT